MSQLTVFLTKGLITAVLNARVHNQLPKKSGFVPVRRHPLKRGVLLGSGLAGAWEDQQCGAQTLGGAESQVAPHISWQSTIRKAIKVSRQLSRIAGLILLFWIEAAEMRTCGSDLLNLSFLP